MAHDENALLISECGAVCDLSRGAEMYIRPKAAAEQLAVSVKLVYKLVERGELEVVKVGRSVRILAASLQAFIARHTQPAKGPDETPAPADHVMPSSPPPPRKRGQAGFVFLPRPS
jgi:excisionase family DNA binding protein